MSMNVYMATPREAQSGGCMIIAAQSLEEANRIAEANRFCPYTELIPDLFTNRTEPGVIIDELYID